MRSTDRLLSRRFSFSRWSLCGFFPASISRCLSSSCCVSSRSPCKWGCALSQFGGSLVNWVLGYDKIGSQSTNTQTTKTTPHVHQPPQNNSDAFSSSIEDQRLHQHQHHCHNCIMRRNTINAWLSDTDSALSLRSPPTSLAAKRKRTVLGELPSARTNPRANQRTNQRTTMQDDERPKAKSHSTPGLHRPLTRTPRTPSPTKRQKLGHTRDAATGDESLGFQVLAHVQDATPRASDFLANHRQQTALSLRGNSTNQPLQHTYFQALSESSEPATSPSREPSSASGTSKRSTSPVKRVLALQEVGGGIRFMDLGDDFRELGDHCRGLFLDLRDDASGQQVIHPAVAKRVQEDAPVRPYHVDNGEDSHNCEAVLLSELAAVRNINISSRRCSRDGESEGEWNTAVHAVLLRLAIHHDTERFGTIPVGFRNV